MSREIENTVIVECQIDVETYKELESFLKKQPEVSQVRFRIRKMSASVGLEHVAPMWDMVVSFAKEAYPHIKDPIEDVAKIAFGALVKNWIDKRNESKKKEIEAGKETPLLYDADGNVIRVKSKRK